MNSVRTLIGFTPLFLALGQACFGAAPSYTWNTVTIDGMSVDECTHRTVRVLEDSGYRNVRTSSTTVLGERDPYAAIAFCQDAPNLLIVIMNNGAYDDVLRESAEFARRFREHGRFREHEGEIAGSWNWWSGQAVIIHRDHTCEAYMSTENGNRRVNQGHWEMIGERRYRLTWDYHGYVNTLTLSDDGRYVDARNEQGETRFSRR